MCSKAIQKLSSLPMRQASTLVLAKSGPEGPGQTPMLQNSESQVFSPADCLFTSDRIREKKILESAAI